MTKHFHVVQNWKCQLGCDAIHVGACPSRGLIHKGDVVKKLYWLCPVVVTVTLGMPTVPTNHRTKWSTHPKTLWAHHDTTVGSPFLHKWFQHTKHDVRVEGSFMGFIQHNDLSWAGTGPLITLSKHSLQRTEGLHLGPQLSIRNSITMPAQSWAYSAMNC